MFHIYNMFIYGFHGTSLKNHKCSRNSHGTSAELNIGAAPWQPRLQVEQERKLEGPEGQYVYPLVMTNITMENHHFSWENPLFLWPFSIFRLVYQRVPGSAEDVFFFLIGENPPYGESTRISFSEVF
jgi:hypothetical protein